MLLNFLYKIIYSITFHEDSFINLNSFDNYIAFIVQLQKQ